MCAMAKRILIIQGHPDSREERFCRALETAYSQGALEAGHEVQHLRLADTAFGFLRSREEWEKGEPGSEVRRAQRMISWAEHIAIFYPLWLGSMPALLKGFFEQVMRPGFAFSGVSSGKMWKKGLKGRSARVVVTMGMPAAVYRWYFRAHSLKSLQRNILGFVGIAPVRATLIGSVETSASGRAKSIKDMRRLGSAGQ
jgi:putative NADPH-quinone reductase